EVDSVFMNTGSSIRPFQTSQGLYSDTNVGSSCGEIVVADVNADGLPDIVVRCAPQVVTFPEPAPPRGASGFIYINNGTTDPFAGVSPLDMPAHLVDPDVPNPLIAALANLSGGSTVDLLTVTVGGAAYNPLIVDTPPVANDDAAVAAENGTVNINVLANDTSPGASIDPTTIAITFRPMWGTVRVSPTNTLTYTPGADVVESDSFQYSVKDKLGTISNPATVTVTVQRAPSANDDTAMTTSGQSVTISVLANDTSGGKLDPSSTTIVTKPLNGTATATADGSILYQPSAGFAGKDTFQYSVKDDLGGVSNVATVTVTVQSPPSTGGG